MTQDTGQGHRPTRSPASARSVWIAVFAFVTFALLTYLDVFKPLVAGLGINDRWQLDRLLPGLLVLAVAIPAQARLALRPAKGHMSQETLSDPQLRNRMTTMLEVVNMLSTAKSFDDMCRQAVELGRNRLGFDRLGLWFLLPDNPDQMKGSFGIDENGNTRDERGKRAPVIDPLMQMLEGSYPHVVLRRDDHMIIGFQNEPLGFATHMCTGLWNGQEIIGFLCCDNVLTKTPVTRDDEQMLAMYASVLGHFCSLRETSDALLASEERFRMVFNAIPDFVFIKNCDRKYVQVNPAVERAFRKSASEFIGTTDLEIYGPETDERIREADLRVLRGDTVETKGDYVILGKSITMHLIKVPMRNHNGDIAGLCGIARDVTAELRAAKALKTAHDEMELRIAERTADLNRINRELTQEIAERKQVEAALSENQERYRSLVNSVPAVLYVAEADTNRVLLLSGAVRDIFGRPADDFYDDVELGSRLIHPEDRQLVHDLYQKGLSAKQPFEGEFRLTREGDHRAIWVHARVVPAFDEHEKMVRQYGVLLNITERKEAEEALARSQQQLMRSERMASIGTLAAGIAHEINNPVGMMLLGAQMALRRRGAPDEDKIVQQSLQSIVRNARRCSRIVKSILQFSRQQPAEKWAIDLNSIVRQSVRLTQTRIHEQKATVEFHLADELPRVLANPVQMEQVVINLILNAIQSGDNQVRVRISTDAGTDKVQLHIADNGRGIPVEERSLVFDPFYTTRLREGGTGLGLSIVHGIVIEHGGTIEISDADGGGAVFTVSLTRTVADEKMTYDENPDR